MSLSFVNGLTCEPLSWKDHVNRDAVAAVRSSGRFIVRLWAVHELEREESYTAEASIFAEIMAPYSYKSHSITHIN